MFFFFFQHDKKKIWKLTDRTSTSCSQRKQTPTSVRQISNTIKLLVFLNEQFKKRTGMTLVHSNETNYYASAAVGTRKRMTWFIISFSVGNLSLKKLPQSCIKCTTDDLSQLSKDMFHSFVYSEVGVIQLLLFSKTTRACLKKLKRIFIWNHGNLFLSIYCCWFKYLFIYIYSLLCPTITMVS